MLFGRLSMERFRWVTHAYHTHFSLQSETTLIRRRNGLATDRRKGDREERGRGQTEIKMMEIGRWVKWIGWTALRMRRQDGELMPSAAVRDNEKWLQKNQQGFSHSRSTAQKKVAVIWLARPSIVVERDCQGIWSACINKLYNQKYIYIYIYIFAFSL